MKCDCGNNNYKRIKPEEIKNKKFGTKHLYKCTNCQKEWWSFFYNLETNEKYYKDIFQYNFLK